MLLGKPNKEDNNVMVANYRGIGLYDMVDSIKKNIQPRCSIDLALHVLEIMEGILISSINQSIYKTTTHCDRPEALNEEEIRSLKV